MQAVLGLCFIIALVASVLFSGAEKAISSISRDSLEKLSENKVRGAHITLGMFKNKRRFRIMMLSGRILSITFGSVILFNILSGMVLSWSPFITGPVVVVISCMAFIVTEGFFARLVSIGEYESRISRFVFFLYFLAVFHVLLYPVTWLLDTVLSLVIKKNLELADKEETFIELVKSESESGVIEPDEREMIESIFEFSDTTVKEVMIPRIDVVAAEKNISFDDLIELFVKEGHTRIPVYEERIDNILGVVYAKDLIEYMAEKRKRDFSISDVMREAYFVPTGKAISELLKEFKKTRVHLAIVIDEYGGTAGVVALEDLLEEIVGEIQDEYDQDEGMYTRIDDATLMVDASMDIGTVNEIIRATLPNDDFDTLGGFLYHQLGFIPEGGEEVRWKSVKFIIEEIKGNRISKVRVKLYEPEEPDEKEPS